MLDRFAGLPKVWWDDLVGQNVIGKGTFGAVFVTKGLFTRARAGHRPGSVQRPILRLHEPGLGEGKVDLG